MAKFSELHQVFQQTSVETSSNGRMFGSGKLPTGLLFWGIHQGTLALTTTRREAGTLNTTLSVRGQFQGLTIDRDLELGKYTPDLANDFDSFAALAEKDIANKATVITSNNQEYFSADKSEPSDFAKNLAVYLATRFLNKPEAVLQIAPLELFRDNADLLYDAVTKAVESEDVQNHLGQSFDKKAFIQFLNDKCCWYTTIDDRIVSTREITGEENGVQNQRVVTEPYATLHFSKAKISKDKSEFADLPSPFKQDGDRVAEVNDLTPYISRKLGLLNAVHVCIVINALMEKGIQNFSDIRDFEHAQSLLNSDVVRDEVNDMQKPGFKRVNLAATALLAILKTEYPDSGINFEAFLGATYERFNNPYVDHKLIDIFQGMDKFPPKILERIGYFVELVEQDIAKHKGQEEMSHYAKFISTPEYQALLEFFQFGQQPK